MSTISPPPRNRNIPNNPNNRLYPYPWSPGLYETPRPPRSDLMLSPWWIAGIVIVCVIVFVLICVCFMVMSRRNRGTRHYNQPYRRRTRYPDPTAIGSHPTSGEGEIVSDEQWVE